MPKPYSIQAGKTYTLSLAAGQTAVLHLTVGTGSFVSTSSNVVVESRSLTLPQVINIGPYSSTTSVAMTCGASSTMWYELLFDADVTPAPLDMSSYPQAAVAAGIAVPNAGISIGVVDASTGERAHPSFSWAATTYSRQNAVVTLFFGKQSTLRSWLLGRWIRITNANFADVEGRFQITAIYPDSGSTGQFVQFYDNRYDITPNLKTYADPKSVQNAQYYDGGLCDLAYYTVSQSWPVHLNIALGGKAEIINVSTGSTNLTDWTPTRLKQLTDRGPYDVIIIGGGLTGNSLLGSAQSSAAVYTALSTIVETLQPFCRMVIVEEPPANRNASPTGSTATAAYRSVRQMYANLVKQYRNVRISPWGSILASNYSSPSVATPSDVVAAWPDSSIMDADGTHGKWGMCVRRGVAQATVISPAMLFWVPEMGILPDSRVINSTADTGGALNPNISDGFWGQVNTKSASFPVVGVIGVQPNSMTLTGSGFAAGMTATAAMEANPEGGANYRIVLNDPVGSAGGPVVQPAWQGTGSQLLTTVLNNSANWGKKIRMYVPLEISWTNRNSINSIELGLFATIGGVEYDLGGPLSNSGLFRQPGSAGNSNLATGFAAAAGSGYVVGDVLTLSGGTSTTTAQVTVVTINGTGGVTGFWVSRAGSYSVTPSNAVATTGGTGTGCTITATWYNQQRACDYGVCGTLREPYDIYVPYPPGTVTAAELRLVITAAPNNVPIGILNVAWYAGLRIDIVDY